MLDVLSNRTYRHLFFAQVIALLGTGLATVALGLLAFDLPAQTPVPSWARPWPSRWWPTSGSPLWPRRWRSARHDVRCSWRST
jgi:hypothetical protein